jgi:hypothetical protein
MKAFLMTCRTLWHCEISNPLNAAAPGSGFRSDPCTDRYPFGKPLPVQTRHRVRRFLHQPQTPCRAILSA